jgi:glutaredoxin 3
MAETPKVKVYSTPVCPWCVRAKDFLKEHGIKFEDIDVSRDHDAAHEMIEKSGQTGVPVIIVGDQVVVGFDRERLMKLLSIEE